MSDPIQPDALANLVDRYCEVWSDPSPRRRAELLAQVWTHDATYTDPSIHAPTSDALLAHIDKVVERRPGCKVVRASLLDVHHGIGRFTWQVIQSDGTTLRHGLDIVEFSVDGKRIRRIVGFVGDCDGLAT